MYNNASYLQYSVTGVNEPFTFSPVGVTVQEAAGHHGLDWGDGEPG